MKDFKKNFHTSEFKIGICNLILLFVSQFFVSDITLWAYSVCFVCSSYIISRSLFKKNRSMDHLYDGLKTSEYKCFLCAVFLLVCSFLHGLDLAMFIFLFSIMSAVFILARGYVKNQLLIKPKIVIQ